LRVTSRGLGDVYKRQAYSSEIHLRSEVHHFLQTNFLQIKS
jgi:hypothetical protein